MKVRFSRLVPFKPLLCMNVYGVLYVRKLRLYVWEGLTERIRVEILNHELIHTALARDYCRILWIGYTIFYLIYFFLWLKLIVLPPYDKAYKDIPFELEAEMFEHLLDYLDTRIKKAWKYLK